MSDKIGSFMSKSECQTFLNNSWGGANGGGKPTESLSLSFATVKIEYYPQNADGTKGDKVPAGWNLQKNVAGA